MNTHRMHRNAFISVSAAVILCCMAPTLGAQDPPAEQTPAPGASATPQQVAPVIKKESRLVLVDAVVTD